jgi:UDP-N-acetylglucosamine transferase subunit ALG13
MDLLLRLEHVLGDRRVVWVTQESARASAMRAEGLPVHILGEWTGSMIRGAGRLIWRSLGLVLRRRPRLVITSGSGIIVPFCVLARLAGAKIVFIETSARVTGPSRSGRVLARIAHRVIVQWEEMCAVYPGARPARSSALLGIATELASGGEGSFLAVGTHSQPFDRLVELVDRAAGAGVLPPPVRAQIGPSSYRMRHADARDIIPAAEMDAAFRSARFIVTHGGTGTISTALRAGRRPLVLARASGHSEHFDDHQHQIVDKLAALGLVVRLDGEITPATLAAAEEPLPGPEALPQLPGLEDRLREALAELGA